MSTRTSPLKTDAVVRFVVIPIHPIDPESIRQGELKQKMVETTKKKSIPETKPKKTEPAKSKTGTSAAKKSKK